MLFFVVVSCKKDRPPADSSKASIHIDSLVLGGFDNVHVYAGLSNVDPKTIVGKGICWGTHSSPANTDNVVTFGLNDAFDILLTSLGQHKQLHFRAYFVSHSDTTWSNDAEISTGGLDSVLYNEYTEGNMDIHQVIRATDRSFVVLAEYYGNAIGWTRIIRIDTLGNILWDKQYNVQEWKEPEFIMQTDDGFLFATTSYVPGGKQSNVIKIDADGNKIWEQGFNKLTWQEFVRLYKRSDNTYTFTNRTFSALTDTGRTDCQFVDYTFDPNGTVINEDSTPVGGKFITYSYAFKALTLADNDFTTTNYWAPPSSQQVPTDILVDHFVNNVLQWEQTYGGAGDEEPAGLVTAPDGNTVVLGYTGSKGITAQSAWLFELDKNTGNMLWDLVNGPQPFGQQSATYPLGIYKSDAGYYLCGDVSDTYYTSTMPFVIKTDLHGTLEWS
jgi:hypothetical protein